MEIVNATLNPLHRLISSYAKRSDRQRYAFLFAFDSRLVEIIRKTSEPLIGQMRLTWWRDILTKAPADRPKGEPLVAMFSDLEPEGLSGDSLLRMIDGWEVMLEDFPWNDRQFDNYADARGGGYFGFALDRSQLSDKSTDIAKLWALWDFAVHCSDTAMKNAAFERCRAIAENLDPPRFDKSGRPLSILCKLAMRDVKSGQLPESIYRPSTAAHIIWHGLTGK